MNASQLVVGFIQVILLLALYIAVSEFVKKHFINKVEKKKEKWHLKGLIYQTELAKNINESIRMSETRHRLLSRVLQAIVLLVLFGVVVYLIPPLRALSYSLLAGAGIAAIIIGFAIQKSFANMFAGIFIGIYEPFRIGDLISVADQLGVVEDITLHHTIIREWRNRRYIIPNSIISDQMIKNYTIGEPKIIKTVEVGISYDSDIDKAKKIVLEQINKHPDLLIPEETIRGTVVKKKPTVQVTEWKDFSVVLRGSFWVVNPLVGYKMKFDLLESIKKRFDKEGIEIPFPYRTLVYKKDMHKKRKKK